MNVKQLANVKSKEKVKIQSIDFYQSLKNKLYQLGIIEGAEISKINDIKISQSSLYEMNGRLFSLRNRDALKIQVVSL